MTYNVSSGTLNPTIPSYSLHLRCQLVRCAAMIRPFLPARRCASEVLAVIVCRIYAIVRMSYTETGEVSREPEAPSFTKKLESAEVFEGTPVRLECDVTGFPQPQVTWYQVR